MSPEMIKDCPETVAAVIKKKERMGGSSRLTEIDPTGVETVQLVIHVQDPLHRVHARLV